MNFDWCVGRMQLSKALESDANTCVRLDVMKTKDPHLINELRASGTYKVKIREPYDGH